MKCDNCRFAPPVDADGFSDECPYFYTYGKEFNDGSCGCTISYSHLNKMEKLRDEAMWYEGTDWGIEHDFRHHGWDVDKTIEKCKHMLGMDSRKTYSRHGKTYYKAYRNYFYAFGEELDFEYLCRAGVMEKRDAKEGIIYKLTANGIKWLGLKLEITIKEER